MKQDSQTHLNLLPFSRANTFCFCYHGCHCIDKAFLLFVLICWLTPKIKLLCASHLQLVSLCIGSAFTWKAWLLFLQYSLKPGCPTWLEKLTPAHTHLDLRTTENEQQLLGWQKRALESPWGLLNLLEDSTSDSAIVMMEIRDDLLMSHSLQLQPRLKGKCVTCMTLILWCSSLPRTKTLGMGKEQESQ